MPAPAAIQRALDRWRERGSDVGVAELAQGLLALSAPPGRALARRLVATALERPEDSLPDRIQARSLRPIEEVAVAELPLERADFVVVDFETTGLSAQRASILEIGAVRVTRLRRSEHFTTLVRPAAPLSRAIADLTGIDDAMVADAPSPQRALAAFRRWLARTPRAPFVAHNAGFDARFLEKGLASCGLPAYRVPVLCTRQLGRRLVPEIGRYNLDHLCAHFGIANRARHRAQGDAEATARAWIELLGIARERHGVRTVGGLLDLQARPAKRRRTR